MSSGQFVYSVIESVIFMISSQVGHLGKAYEEWVHQPIISREGPRFFGSDFLEVKPLVYLEN